MVKAFEKQTKTTEVHEEKQVDALKVSESSDKKLPLIKNFIWKERQNTDIIYELKKIEGEEKNCGQKENGLHWT